MAAMEPAQALARLEGPDGPSRFGMVSPRLYRGGQPTAEHLALLRAIGVTRVIDLRREALGVRRAEQAAARHLGLRFIEYPFYGLFGADPRFMERLLEELARDDGGAIYVHCDDGRERTALVVALHRVVTEGWDPDRAWRDEVLAYGHRPSPIFREIELTFRDHAQAHRARDRSIRQGPARRQAVTSSIEDEAGRVAGHAPRTAPRALAGH